MDASKLTSFKRWMSRSGAEWDGVELRASPGGQRGACVVATRVLQEGTVMLSLPKSAVLSVCNASNAKVLTSLLQDGLSDSAALNLAIAHERDRGSASRASLHTNLTPPETVTRRPWSSIAQAGSAIWTRCPRPSLCPFCGAQPSCACCRGAGWMWRHASVVRSCWLSIGSCALGATPILRAGW